MSRVEGLRQGILNAEPVLLVQPPPLSDSGPNPPQVSQLP